MKKIFRIAFLTYPKLSSFVGLLIILSVGLELPLPLLTVFFIDKVLPNKNIDMLNKIGLALIGFLIFKNIVDYGKSYFNAKLNETLTMKYAVETYSNIVYSTYQNLIGKPVGYWTNRIQNEPQSLAWAFRTFIDIITTTITFIVGIVLIFLFNAKLGVVILLILPIYAYASFTMSVKIKKCSKEVKEEKSYLSGVIEEAINGFETIKVLTLELFKISELKKNWMTLFNTNMRLIVLMGINNFLSSVIVSMAPIAVLWYGGYLVIQGSMTLGQVVGINRFLSYVFKPVSSFLNINAQLQDAIVAFERFDEITKIEKENRSGGKVLLNDSDGIRLEKLNFSYGDKKVIENFNFAINGGVTTAIIGSSGCGKSTLLRLIVKLLNHETGEIYIGDKSISDIDVNNLREQVCLIPQNTFLFSGNLNYNLSFGKETDMENIIVKLSAIDKFVTDIQLNKNYDLGSKGLKLSGGQRQRIALARTLFKEPKILLMDEVTSEVDSITEKEIVENIIEYRKGKTTVIVAHSFSSVKKADEIILLSTKGSIERGTHGQLLESSKMYAEFWKAHIG